MTMLDNPVLNNTVLNNRTSMCRSPKPNGAQMKVECHICGNAAHKFNANTSMCQALCYECYLDEQTDMHMMMDSLEYSVARQVAETW